MKTTTDDARFLAQLDAHRPILYKVANAYCRERDDRPDLIQEIVIQLWQSYGRYDERLPFSTWMYRVAMNVAISFYRREQRRTRDRVALDGTADDLAAADRMLDDGGDELRELHRQIAKLDELNRALILLHLDGYGHDAIAETIGISATNVATRLGRIKQRMKEELGS
jgi:RNA polymerase sigma factor (sigma-70 family)